MEGKLDQVFLSASNGKHSVAGELTRLGVATAPEAPFSTIKSNITTLSTNWYNAGVTAADARVNTSSASYSSGFSAGQNGAAESVVSSFMDISGRANIIAGVEYPLVVDKKAQVLNEAQLRQAGTKYNEEHYGYYPVYHDDNFQVKEDLDFCLSGNLLSYYVTSMQIADYAYTYDLNSRRIVQKLSRTRGLSGTAYASIPLVGSIWDKTLNVKVCDVNVETCPEFILSDYGYAWYCNDHRYHLASARDAAPSAWGNAEFSMHGSCYYEQPTAYSYSGYVYNAERLSHSYVFIPSVSVNRVVGMIKQIS